LPLLRLEGIETKQESGCRRRRVMTDLPRTAFPGANPRNVNSMTRTAQQIDSPRAWQMAGVAFVVGFIVFGVLYSFGVFLEPFMTDFGASRSATSALYAISSSAFYFLGPVTAGSVTDGGRASSPQ
jgi:hypothetical protein